jgi:hypothetical protein
VLASATEQEKTMAEETPESTPVGATSDGAPSGTYSYVESADHVPDPTAMTGTMETTGTGGGVNERVAGTTRIFGDVERVVAKVEAIVQERVGGIVDEVRGLLKREEAHAVTQNLPQQTVENNGVPEHGGNIVAPNNDTGAAQDAPLSANVAGSPDDVDAGTTPVAESGANDSYGQQVIAGASNPQDEATAAQEGEERRESDAKDEAPAKKTAAKKTDDASK